MGLFDNLLAPFSTDAQDKAAQDQINAIKTGQTQYNNYAGTARNALTDNFAGALSSVGQGNNALGTNYGAAVGALGTNYGAGQGALSTNYAAGLGALSDAYGKATAPLAYNFGQGQAGTTALGNALGLNGAGGNAAATAAFWNNPGIQAQLDIGSENVMRKAAATGGPASGSTLAALQDYGQQVASQGWNNYVSQLQPYLNYSNSAAAGLGNLYSGYGNQAANMYTNLGNQSAGLYQGLGNQLSGVYGNLGQGLNQNALAQAGMYTGLGTQLANSFTNQGQAAYGANASMGNAQANADLAPLTAGSNLWSGIIGAAGAAAGSPTGAFGKALNNIGGAAFNYFGSNAGSTGQPNVGPFPTVSDARVKDDIRPIGKLADGLNVYAFRYKGSPRTQIGLMAQEVEKVIPDAVIDIGGIKAVDYKRATDFAGELMKLAA